MFESSSKPVETLSRHRDRELAKSTSGHALSKLLGEWVTAGKSWLAQRLFWGRSDEQAKADYYSQLMACHSEELITTHTANGETLHASMASISVTGASDFELLGSGLLNKLHLQDRIVFLKMISEVSIDGKEQSAQLRLRNSIDAESAWRNLTLTFRRNQNPRVPEEQVVGVLREPGDLAANVCDAASSGCFAVECDGSRFGRLQPNDTFQQRAFTRSVAPKQGDDFAFV